MKDFPDSSSFPAKWIDRLDNRKNPINVLLSFHLRLNIIGGERDQILFFFLFASRTKFLRLDTKRRIVTRLSFDFQYGRYSIECPRDELGVGSISTRRVVRSLRNRSLSRQATSFPFFSPSFLPPPTNEKRENSGEAREETLQETSNNRRKLHKISGATLGRFSAEERGGGGGRIENVIKDNEASFPC